MTRIWITPLMAGVIAGGLVSCGGGGGATAVQAPPAARTTGFAVPTEVSPVSTGAVQVQSARFRPALAQGTTLRAMAAADPGTDYSNAQTVRFVSEHAIDQFSIIETILNAVSQTHYADAENIGAGPYKSIVSWQQNNGDGQSKTVQTWIVDSSIIQEAGHDVNLVNAWIEDSGRVIRAQFKISASAAQAADGSYLDYGVWTLEVKFDQAGSQYFVAQASIGASGEAVVAINEYQQGGGNNTFQTTQAVMHKSATAGYGMVFYPDQSDNSTVQTTASYVYNASQLLVHHMLPAPSRKTWQDRTASVEIASQYGLYDSVTGADVMTSHSFGFPVLFTLDGVDQYGYYGANQGADQVWINGGALIPDGTAVTRQDQGASGASYLTASFNGTLAKRTYIAGTIGDLLNIPVQTFVNIQKQLTYTGGQWTEDGAAFTDFGSLASQPQKWVWINGWASGQPLTLCYDPLGASGPGFYPASMNNGSMMPVPGGARYAPVEGDQLWVNIGGSIYIEYKGVDAGWVRKSVASFNQTNWTPTFDPNGDTPFTLGLGTQYSISNQGGNFVVTQTALSPAAYSVQMEVQAPVNPVNVADVIGTAVVFKPQNYDAVQSSTYRFISDPAAANGLKLVYLTVGAQDAKASPAPNVGDVVSQGQYSLEAFDGQNQDLGLQYDWNYPSSGNTMGIQTFLYTAAGTGRAYHLLDNPIQLAPLDLTVNGSPRTLSLQFDGWMHGLPDYSSDLAMDDYTITSAISDKIINIPAGTPVTDQVDPSKSYLIKPLRIGVYLPVAASPDLSLDLTAADGLDLNDPAVIPGFVDNGLGAEPSVSVVKYSDGVKVQ